MECIYPISCIVYPSTGLRVYFPGWQLHSAENRDGLDLEGMRRVERGSWWHQMEAELKWKWTKKPPEQGHSAFKPIRGWRKSAAFLKCAARSVLTVCVEVEVSYRVTIVVTYNTCIHICTHIDAYVHTYSCKGL